MFCQTFTEWRRDFIAELKLSCTHTDPRPNGAHGIPASVHLPRKETEGFSMSEFREVYSASYFLHASAVREPLGSASSLRTPGQEALVLNAYERLHHGADGELKKPEHVFAEHAGVFSL